MKPKKKNNKKNYQLEMIADKSETSIKTITFVFLSKYFANCIYFVLYVITK